MEIPVGEGGIEPKWFIAMTESIGEYGYTMESKIKRARDVRIGAMASFLEGDGVVLLANSDHVVVLGAVGLKVGMNPGFAIIDPADGKLTVHDSAKFDRSHVIFISGFKKN
jgi:hypothetical protein